MSYLKRALATLTLGVVVSAGCQRAAPDEQRGGAAVATEGQQTYVVPAAGVTSLVESVRARRNERGDVVVDGRLLLPESTRVWIELYPAASPPDADPSGRAELYLGPGGSFETEALKAPPASEFRILITSHFTRSWQSSDVLAAVGAGGAKLPAGALTPNDPNNSAAGSHLEVASLVKVSGS
jgi:hypothetical protein